MSTILCYRGRTVTASDLETIRALLKAHPEASRRAFSQRLCEHWDWRQPNGALRDMVCRSLLLVLHRAEHIRLPAVRHRPPNNAIARRRPMALGVDRTPLEGRLDALRPVELLAVVSGCEEPRISGAQRWRRMVDCWSQQERGRLRPLEV